MPESIRRINCMQQINILVVDDEKEIAELVEI